MNTTVHNVKTAIEMRRAGRSYAEIAKALKVSRASVCNWVKNVRLTEGEKSHLEKNIKSRVERGRLMASVSIRTRKVYKEKVAYESAEKDFEKLSKDPFFMFGMGMGGIEKGSSKAPSFQFTTSDEQIMKLILKWIEKYLKIPRKSLKYRLFLARALKPEEYATLWSKNLGISMDQIKEPTYLRVKKGGKDREYKGSLGFSITRVEPVRRIIAWQKLTMLYYS